MLTVKSGKVIGRGHLLASRNCQDSLKTFSFTLQDKIYHVGWISDGCSKGAYSEVGSTLATQFLTNQSVLYLKDGVPLEAIPLFLFEDLLIFLRQNLTSQNLPTPQDQAQYVNDYLLFTLVGFLIGPKSSQVMAYGDGLVIINDQIYRRDFQDESDYPGYLLLDPRYLNPSRRLLPSGFDIYPLKTADIQKLAIGSDAWLSDFDLLDHIWGHSHPNQIQRNLNIWSDQKRLADDASLIVVETAI